MFLKGWQRKHVGLFNPHSLQDTTWSSSGQVLLKLLLRTGAVYSACHPCVSCLPLLDKQGKQKEITLTVSNGLGLVLRAISCKSKTQCPCYRKVLFLPLS